MHGATRSPAADTTVNPFRWVGRYGYYQDASTGLVYVRARMYQPTVARWCSVDPIKHLDGLNTFRFAKNRPNKTIDPSGLMVLGIDGTSSGLFREGLEWKWTCWIVIDFPVSYPMCGYRLVRSAAGRAPLTNTLRRQSHVFNFVNDYDAPDAKKNYLDGPDSSVNGTTSEVRGKIAEGFQWVCETYCKSKCSEPIDIVGHSRGGLIAIEIARRLDTTGCSCMSPPVPVRFLGLYDPVDMTPGIGAIETIPGNVQHCTHLLAIPETESPFTAERSRKQFNRIDGYPEKSGTVYHRIGIFGTHSAIGGAPWWGDWPRGHSKGNDIRAAIDSDRYVRADAIAAGVPISLVSDYGYDRRIMPIGSPEEGG